MVEQGGEAGRATPYERILGEPGIGAARFPSIAEALQEAGRDGRQPDVFFMIPGVTELLRELAPEGSQATHGYTQLGLFVFHAYHAWAQGAPPVRLTEEELRPLLEGETVGEWALRPPAPAGYIQLPRNLVWSRPDAQAPPEAVDGFFWVQGAATGGPLELLFATGLHDGRAGLTVIEMSVLPPPAGSWADIAARPEGDDFSNVLPGGERDRLYALTNAGEALKLASRVFWHLDTHGSVRDRAGTRGDR